MMRIAISYVELRSYLTPKLSCPRNQAASFPGRAVAAPTAVVLAPLSKII
jgi:hypothetical protein